MAQIGYRKFWRRETRNDPAKHDEARGMFTKFLNAVAGVDVDT
jgi:hypothetical protein